MPGRGEWEPEQSLRGEERPQVSAVLSRAGAELLLSAPVRFQGSVVFAGQLNVKAGEGGKINGPCIAVKSNFTLLPEARLSLQGCENQALGMAGYGGCLRVGGDAKLLGGQLLLRECKAEAGATYGGGIYVGGRTGVGCFVLERRRLGTLARGGLLDACC